MSVFLLQHYSEATGLLQSDSSYRSFVVFSSITINLPLRLPVLRLWRIVCKQYTSDARTFEALSLMFTWSSDTALPNISCLPRVVLSNYPQCQFHAVVAAEQGGVRVSRVVLSEDDEGNRGALVLYLYTTW